MLIEDTPENRALVLAVTGKPSLTGKRCERLILDDGSLRRINGRYVVGNVCVLDEAHDRPAIDRSSGVGVLVSRRHRFRIPKGHPWRGKRP